MALNSFFARTSRNILDIMDKLYTIQKGRTVPFQLTVHQRNLLTYFTPMDFVFLQDLLLDDEFLSFDEAVNFIITLRKRSAFRFVPARAQSEANAVDGTDTSQEKEHNIEFTDAPEQIDLVVGGMSTDPTFTQGQQEDAGLGDFLSRPIVIHSITWAVNAVTPFLASINPWQLYLNNSKVLNKLETFKLLHGTLKIKAVVNGSQFHYGRVLAGVRPTKYDNNTSAIDPTTTQATTNYQNQYVAGVKSVRSGAVLYSSRPHVFIDPTTNQPVHIDWPFFAATNWIDLMDERSVDRLGRLEIWELNQLRHANGSTDAVTITFYAWLEDVELTGLTTGTVAVAQSQPRKSKSKSSVKLTNSSNSKDEYSAGGAISTPATTVMKAAQYFTSIPYIGPFAKATELAAGATADIAKLFGFSRPNIVNDVMIMRPQTTSNLSHTVGGDSLIKLTLDPKQGLTVDPSTVGLPGTDQMSFGYLAKQEAWIDSFPYNQTIAPGTALYGIKVHPMLRPIDSTGDAGGRLWQTPISFVTQPFAYWTGSLRYRFQIVASAFHRGRIAIAYDPNESTPTSPDYNSNYIEIIDIEETKDFTIEVKWSQPQAYGSTELFGLTVACTGTPIDFNSGTFIQDPSTNGTLSVYVVNELASPIDASEIEINVYLSAGDDFEVQAPRDSLVDYTFNRSSQTTGPPATTQSQAIVTENENDPSQSTNYLINGSYCGCDPNRSSVYFGEAIVSSRSLLKRYCFHRPMVVTGLSADTVYNKAFTQFNFPNGPGGTYGSSIASEITPIGSGNYNLCVMTYLRYYASAYIGWRGGIRWKVINYKGQSDISLVKVARSSKRINEETVVNTIMRGGGATTLNTCKRYLSTDPNGHMLAGSAVNSVIVNPSLEYEVPLYTPYRYVEINEPPQTILAGSFDQFRYQSHYNGGGHSVSTINRNANTDTWPYLEAYCAAGEDFSLFFFIGAPPMYETDVPHQV